MTIETQTPAVQLALTGKARIAVTHLERFAQREDSITVAQAKPIDDALLALSAALLAAGIGGVPVDPLVAQVSNGSTILVKNSAGSVTKTATVAVAGSVVTAASLAATSAIVDNAQVVTVQNNNSSQITASAPANVAAGVVSNVRLPATAFGVATGSKVAVGTVTGTGTFGTFTVAGGAITGIVLSAS